MRTTGIVRRTDDLGRIVIPREVRTRLRIKDGDPLEIFIEDNNIVLKKYSALLEMDETAKDFADTLSKTAQCAVIITNTNNVIAVSGTNKRPFMGISIGNQLSSFISERNKPLINENLLPIVGNECNFEYKYQLISQIMLTTEIFGSIILLSDEKFSEIESKLVETASMFLAKQCEF